MTLATQMMLRALLYLLVATSCTTETDPTSPSAPHPVIQRPCATLGNAWVSGHATQTSGAIWDTSRCSPQPGDAVEVVLPAIRDANQWGTALCNDGTPFGFELHLSHSQSAVWVVHLQGGGWCDDDVRPCQARDQRYTTGPIPTDGTLLTRQRRGIFSNNSTDNPLFHDANRAYLEYCTSDVWTGNRDGRVPITGIPDGWLFSGRRTISATLDVLTQRYGLRDAPETRLLFTGGSAGAVGALANAREVAQRFSQGQVKIVADGGFLPNFTVEGHTIDPTGRPDADLMIAAYARWGSRLDVACEAAQQAGQEHPSRCFLGMETIAHLQSSDIPVLVQQSLHDHWALKNHRIDYGDPADAEVLDAWRIATHQALEHVAWAHVRGGRPYHTLLTRDVRPSGEQSFGHLLDAFWNGGAPIRRIDDR